MTAMTLEDIAAKFGVAGLKSFITGSSLAGGLGSAGGGLAASAMFSGSPGYGQMGATVGAGIGSLLMGGGFGPGMLGGIIGGSLASNIGPNPTVGPNGNWNYSVGPDGQIYVAASGGDNGITPAMMRAFGEQGIGNFNNIVSQNGGTVAPGRWGVEAGGMAHGQYPTVQGEGTNGWFMAPYLNENSPFKALVQSGRVSGDKEGIMAALGGEDDPYFYLNGAGDWGKAGSGGWWDDPNYQLQMQGMDAKVKQAAAPGVDAVWGNSKDYTNLGYHYAGGGYVDGEDDGMADTVATSIEGVAPAALSHGEYVLTADIVAALGDGNNKAGAKKLDGLVSLIRQKKYGRDKQPPPIGLPSLLKRAKIV